MSELRPIPVPDIGDFDAVDVVEVHVAVGDTIAPEDALITLESDKASLDVPAPFGGTVREVLVAPGDRVSQGDPIVRVEASAEGAAREEGAAEPDSTPADDAPAAASASPDGGGAASATTRPGAGAEPVELPAADVQTDVLVLGAGPGGYTAAFRAADLGLDVVMVDEREVLGGVCLNVGCIPSKAMLHAAAVIDEAERMADHGVHFGAPRIDLDALNAWKDQVVARLTKGLATLADKRKVRTVQGRGTFEGPHLLSVEGPEGASTVAFRHVIVAAGSRPVMIPDFPVDDERLMTSDEAIRFAEVPGRLLVIGGGIIGLEMAQVYSSLGSKVTVVELMDGLMPGADRDLVRPLERRIQRRYEAIYTGTKVTGIKALKKGLKVSFEGKNAPDTDTYDRVLVAVGRRPNGDRLGIEKTGVQPDERGFLRVDGQMRTSVPHVFAIGDVAGQPMLAHKATHEAKVAAEVIAGEPAAFDARVIPSVAYTDPEVAWVGMTEEEARRDGVDFEKGQVPWAASGRALGLGRTDGLTKLLFERESGRLIGAGIVGPAAGDLIAEAALAIEMGADAGDIGLTIHPHPTLSETLAFAAEIVDGTVTDLYAPKKRERSGG